MGRDNRPATTRRTVLGATAAAATFGLSSVASAQESAQRPDFGGWIDGVDGGFEDARGQSEVTVQVGADGNTGTFAFSPAGLWIDPGTTVTFEWASNTHNVMVEAQPSGAGWAGHEPIEDEGFSFSHTFETAGIYEYFCQPHLSMGMKGGVAVGDDVPTAAASAGGDGGGESASQPVAPGGELGLVFVALALATGGLGAIAVLAGEHYGSVRARTEGRHSAYLAGVGAAVLGLVLLAAIVFSLLTG